MIEKYNIYVGILKLSQTDFTRPIMNFPQTMRNALVKLANLMSSNRHNRLP